MYKFECYEYYKGNLSDQAHINHICDAINEIGNYVKYVSFNNFSKSSEKKFASVKQLEIIGEAASRITKQTKSNHPEVEWAKIIALRNILVHEYYVIDEQVLWNIITEDLPYLKNEIVSLLKKLKQT